MGLEVFMFSGLSEGVLVLLIILAIFDSILKIIGMWKSARNNQIVWFILLAVLNTLGILPLIYLTWFQKKKRR